MPMMRSVIEKWKNSHYDFTYEAVMNLERYEPPHKNTWTGRDDVVENERVFEVIKLLDLTKPQEITTLRPGYALIGFCSDVGVKKNRGREGARLGPKNFRKFFGNLTVPHNHMEIYDLGNILCEDDDLEASQKELRELVSWAVKHNLMPLIIGGGHEISWGAYRGATNDCAKNAAIINFDAHFDLRSLETGANSGNSFSLIADLCHKSGQHFSYLVIGIQNASNTKTLYQQAMSLGTSFITAMDIHLFGVQNALIELEKFLKENDKIYLSICLDVFAQSFAPGVSAPQPLGLLPNQVLSLLKNIMDSRKVIAIDLAELSPPHDEGEKTARLSASIIHSLLGWF